MARKLLPKERHRMQATENDISTSRNEMINYARLAEAVELTDAMQKVGDPERLCVGF
jgi:hypothetical protein